MITAEITIAATVERPGIIRMYAATLSAGIVTRFEKLARCSHTTFGVLGIPPLSLFLELRVYRLLLQI